MKGVAKDFRHAFRSLLKSPGFSLLAILALAIGIGVNTAIFTVVHGILIKPLPYKDPDRIMILWEKSTQMDTSVSYPNFLDWSSSNEVFQSMAAFRRDSFNLTGRGEPVHLQSRMISAEFFQILGVNPLLGRNFHKEEDRPGGAPVTILSYTLWQNQFGSDKKILGKQISLNDKSYTIIGVAPKDFGFGVNVDLFVPIGQFFTDRWARGNHPGIYVLGKMKPDANKNKVQANLDTLAKRLEKQYPESNAGRTIVFRELHEDVVHDIRSSLLMVMGAVSLVLFIACANVANMMLARAVERKHEMAIQAALGASRGRLMQQVLVEGLVLSLIASAIGILIAYWGIDVLFALRPDSLPRLDEIHLSPFILAYTLSLTVLTTVIFGSIPAWKASAPDLNDSLKESGHHTGTLTNRRVRQLLIVSEFALAVLLVLGACLLVKSFLATQSEAPGFNPDNVLTLQLSLSDEKYQGVKIANFFDELQRKIQELPGVQSVAVSNGIPIYGASEELFQIEGKPKPVQGSEPNAVLYVTSRDYLKTMRLRLIKGRFFTSEDTVKSLPVAVIDEMLAKQYLAGEDPIGKRIVLAPEVPPFEIIGVVAHVKHYGLDVVGPVQAQYYLCFEQIPEQFLVRLSGRMSVLVRTESDPSNLISAVRKAVMQVDSNQPVFLVQTMNEMLSTSLAPRRFAMLLLTIFAVIALALALVGVYGVMSYLVVQRTREIGIRVAFGASNRNVLATVLKQGMLPVALGLVLGLAGSAALARMLSGLLYGVSPHDPLIYCAIPMFMIGVALLANYIPARRALNIDPVVALRYE
ncbi:MAG TPA: ABC transporter permease [Acidobacteriota bacterium]|nr:ABC transporter permease [Acidobacteriota bacterium]